MKAILQSSAEIIMKFLVLPTILILIASLIFAIATGEISTSGLN